MRQKDNELKLSPALSKLVFKAKGNFIILAQGIENLKIYVHIFLLQVSIVIHTGIIKLPFMAKFTSGNKSWEVPGTFEGTDSTNIKLELNEVSLLEGNRKFSRM